MALGDQGKALRIISKAKGWDPTKCEGVDISNFDKAPDPWLSGSQSTGKLPEGTPLDFPQADGGPAMTEKVTWGNSGQPAVPKSHATKGADPFAGMGGTAV